MVLLIIIREYTLFSDKPIYNFEVILRWSGSKQAAFDGICSEFTSELWQNRNSSRSSRTCLLFSYISSSQQCHSFVQRCCRARLGWGMQPSWRRTTELQSMSSSVDNVHTVARYVRICLCYLVLTKVTKACFERISIASPPSDDCNILHKFAHMTYYIYTHITYYIYGV